MTNQDLQAAADWLAVNLMGWRHCDCCGGFWDKEENFIIDWEPYLPTPEGLFQCFGPGGIVEKMEEKEWPFFELFKYIAPEKPLGFKYWSKFYKDEESEYYSFADILGAAIVLAAKAVLENEKKGEN